MVSDSFPQQFMPIFKKFHISPDQFLGKGGEGYVYDHGDGQVIKIYPNTSIDYLVKLQDLQRSMTQARLPYKTPHIESINESEGICYTIEKKLTGQNLETVFATLSLAMQKTALRNYLNALKPLRNILMPDASFGQILDVSGALQSESWKDFLINKLHQKTSLMKHKLSQDVIDFSRKVSSLENLIDSNFHSHIEKSFVHGDYYLNNVLVNEKLEITSVLDMSIHSCIGDYRLDVAGINFLPLCTSVTLDHLSAAHDFVIENYGEEIIPYLDLYGFYYAFYFSNTYEFDTTTYQWCLSILNDENRWKKYF